MSRGSANVPSAMPFACKAFADLWPQWLRQSAASHAARSYNVSRSKILRL